MLKKKNVFILIIMIVFLLLSGCGGKPNGEGASSEPFFVNCDSDFVKHGDIIYFYEGGLSSEPDSKLRFLDVSTGECMPLCGKPDCMHNGADCNASVNATGFIRLMLYNGRLFWIESGSPEFILYSIKTDGTDRRKELTLDDELYSLAYGEGTAEIHEGVLYVCGSASRVSDGKPSIVCTVFSQPLNGGEAKLIYRSDERAFIFGKICGDILYFAESEMWPDSEDNSDKPLVLKLFSYNTKTEELAELYRDERANAYYRYLLAVDDALYLAGYQTAAVFSPADKSFSHYRSDNNMAMDIGEGIMLRWESPNSYLCSDLNGVPLFQGAYPPEGLSGQPSGKIYIGSSNNKFYYYACLAPDDWSSENWYIMEFDLETHETKVLWEYEIKFD